MPAAPNPTRILPNAWPRFGFAETRVVVIVACVNSRCGCEPVYIPGEGAKEKFYDCQTKRQTRHQTGSKDNENKIWTHGNHAR